MEQDSLFGASYHPRFLDKFLGNMIKDPVIAIIELVANAFDAGAKHVYIKWPTTKELGGNSRFEIVDDGKGLSLSEFKKIWGTLNYDRIANQGNTVQIFDKDKLIETRTVYGKNGKGRFSSFCFNDKYTFESTKDNKTFSCEVLRSSTEDTPLILKPSEPIDSTSNNGVKILADIKHKNALIELSKLRMELSARFISRPSFKIFVNGDLLTLQDIPKECITEKSVKFKDRDILLRLIDTNKVDISVRQRGVAWWVQGRLVGDINWSFLKNFAEFDQRSTSAKKYNLIIEADCLHEYDLVLPDWNGFDTNHNTWHEFEKIMIPAVRELIEAPSLKESTLKANAALNKVRSESEDLGLLSKSKLISFVDQSIKFCPSLSEATLHNLAKILINLEKSSNKYNLIQKMSSLSGDQLDKLDSILEDWGVDMAKVILDEIGGRIKTIAEFKLKMDVPRIDEVHELQVLFEKSLWMFGPQFESIEFTSNKGMTHALQNLFKKQKIKGSRLRPDFLILPDTSVGFYTIPNYDEDYQPKGISHLVILDLKTTKLRLGSTETDQVWTYVKELRSHGVIDQATRVDAFVLGDSIQEGDNEQIQRGNNVRITPMLYMDIVMRAEKRMMNLFNHVKESTIVKSHIENEQNRLREIYGSTPELAY